MKMEFSAGGIVYKKEGQNFKVALILDSYDKWTFPKGHIEKGEKPENAARREVGEEIGVKEFYQVKLLDKINYWFKSPPTGGSETIHKFVYFYLMEVASKKVLKPQINEIKEVRWFKPEEALKILGYQKDSGELLKKAIKNFQ